MEIKVWGKIYECDKAVRNGDNLTLYSDGKMTMQFDGVADWSAFEGDIVDITPTAEQIEVTELKRKLLNTDYIAAKIAEGAATREDYAEQIAQREIWRERINELET